MEAVKILVVDDEQDVADNLSKFIARKFNCQVEKAYNGAAALEKIKAIDFNLVVLDIKMPGLSGIDVIREAVKCKPQIKILAVSAYDSKEVAGKALTLGAIDYMHKPQTVEAMELKIRQLLGQEAKG